MSGGRKAAKKAAKRGHIEPTEKTPPAKPKNPGAFTARRARLAAFAAAASMTPDQRIERARAAGVASGIARRAAREAAGLPAATPYHARRRPSMVELAPWLEEVDRLYPDAEWTAEERKSQAIRLLRVEMARDELAYGDDA